MATEKVKLEVDARALLKMREALGEITDEEKRLLHEMQKVNKESSSMGKTLGNIGKAIAGLAIADKMADAAREIVRVQASFQKMEATLRLALGSQSAAQQAMDMIINIAKTTPFQVEGLTESYIKLVNRGIKPTQEEIINLGDLAATTGKDFDQLTEAVLDATTGEFERLKEFGIRASKEGDRVTFTFKGVQQQVAFTEDAIKDYIVGLGDLNGVQGAMAAQAATLGGAFSNLEDSTTQLFRALGDSQGMLEGLVRDAASFVDTLTDLVSGQGDWREELAKTTVELDAEFGLLKDLTGASEDDNVAREEKRILIEQLNAKYGTYLPSLLTEESSLEDIEKAYNAVNKALAQNILLKARAEITSDAESEMARLSQAVVQIDVIRKRAEQAGRESVELTLQELDQLRRIQDEIGTEGLGAGETFASLFGGDTSVETLESLRFQILGAMQGIKDGMQGELSAIEGLADDLNLTLEQAAAQTEEDKEQRASGMTMSELKSKLKAFNKLREDLRDEDFANTHNWYEQQLRALDEFQAESAQIIASSGASPEQQAEVMALLENVVGARRLELRKEWNNRLAKEMGDAGEERLQIREREGAAQLSQAELLASGELAVQSAKHQQELEAERQHQEEMRRIRRENQEALLQVGQDLMQSYMDFQGVVGERNRQEAQRIGEDLAEIQELRAQTDENDIERLNMLIERESQIRDEKEKTEQAAAAAYSRQRDMQIAQAVLAGALAVQQVFATPAPLPIKIAQAIAIAAKTGTQIAVMRNTPQGFAEGGLVGGEGHPDGIDTVPAMLTKGERVMTVDKTRRYGKTLEAIHKGEIAPDVLESVAALRPKSIKDLEVLAPRAGLPIALQTGQNNAEVVEELRAVKAELAAIRHKPTMAVNLDRQGFTTTIENDIQRRKYLNQKGKFRNV